MKKIVRLTEGDLHRIVKESVKRTLKEYWQPYNYDLWDDNDFWPEDDDKDKFSNKKESSDNEISNKTKDDSPRKKWFKRFRK